jgi:bifunctional non-homologous end joining protein LigD
MNLKSDQNKRDFTFTLEPPPSKSKDEKEMRFVVQRHEASHLHYDFRLEMDGVLKSWAIPKGPSLNSKDKRLAIRVEDHPCDYIHFEGEIPEGNYGAGTVSIFDEGTYESIENKPQKSLLEALKDGDLKFRLNGNILKGAFSLLKLKNSNPDHWLLIKHRDEFSVSSKFNIEKIVSKQRLKEDLMEA